MPTNGNKQYPYEFVCKDSGIVLHLRKVPFTVTSQLHSEYEKQFPPPEPPYTMVDYGEGDKVKESNTAHPTYLKLLQEWESKRNDWVNERARHVFSDFAVQCDVDQKAVDELRVAMKKQGVALDSDDKFVFIWNIAVGTGDGYGELFAAIQRRSQVTQEAVAEATERFPNQIPTA